MDVTARLQYARASAQKVGLVCDQVRGKSVAHALDLLKFSDKKAAFLVRKLLNSAIANAEHNAGADIDELKVKTIYANRGSTYKRMHARAKGRGCRILKPTCHITIVVSDEEKV